MVDTDEELSFAASRDTTVSECCNPATSIQSITRHIPTASSQCAFPQMSPEMSPHYALSVDTSTEVSYPA